MRTQAAPSPVRKSIRRLVIGAAGPSRDPTAVKRNDVQELAVKIPLCEEGNLVRSHPAGESQSCHASVGPYNAPSIFVLTSLEALLCCCGSNLYISQMRICVCVGCLDAAKGTDSKIYLQKHKIRIQCLSCICSF